MSFQHEPVLLREVLEWMNVKPSGVYCDGTLGGGGHSEAILAASGGTASLYGIDRDMNAIHAAGERLARFPGFHALSGNFHDAAALLREAGAEKLDGALLDLGVYGLNFIQMFCASPVVATSSHCVKFPTGVDASETITLEMEDGSMACIQTSALCQGENTGSISGTAGCLVFDDVNSPRRLSVYQKGHVLVKEFEAPGQITGFEYQFRACRDAMAAGLLETPQMPHSEILYIMEQMDRLRASWGVRFPMD